MSNPETQPQTESNLQTLETEMTLTQQEMEEFRRLPKEEREKQKDERLAKLFDLQARLDQAVQEGIKTGDSSEAQKLKDELDRGIQNLEEIVAETELSPEDEKIFHAIKNDRFGFLISPEKELTHITPEIAKLIIGDHNIFLENLNFISDDVAKVLSKNQGDINLSGLTSISDVVAKYLSKISGSLNLDGLTSISDTAAKHLSGLKNGALDLNGLTSISDLTAGHLSKFYQGNLELRGLTYLSDTAAEYFSKSEIYYLDLNGVKSLSDVAIEHLSKHLNLQLYGLRTVSDKAAKYMAEHGGYSWNVNNEVREKINSFKKPQP